MTSAVEPAVRALGSAEAIILHRVAELNRRGHEPSVWEAVTGTRWPATGRLSPRGRSYRYTVAARLLEAGELENVAPAGSTSKRLRIGRTCAPSESYTAEELRRQHSAAQRESERLATLLAARRLEDVS